MRHVDLSRVGLTWRLHFSKASSIQDFSLFHLSESFRFEACLTGRCWDEDMLSSCWDEYVELSEGSRDVQSRGLPAGTFGALQSQPLACRQPSWAPFQMETRLRQPQYEFALAEKNDAKVAQISVETHFVQQGLSCNPTGIWNLITSNYSLLYVSALFCEMRGIATEIRGNRKACPPYAGQAGLS